MRRIYVDNLKGTEILARTIHTSTGTVLLSNGTSLKKSYISKLKELGIDYIYIDDELSEGIEINDYVDEKTRENAKQEVRKVLDKFSTSGKVELDGINQTALNIIDDILLNKDILVNISDIRREDEYNYSHSVNVCALSVLTALKKGYTVERARDLAIGALLHDLGKVLIPHDIIKKKGELTYQERELIKQHPINGYEAIKDETWLSGISKVIILTHHETLDGSGYPFGWVEDKIHDSTKIVTICNVFDAMTSNKHYRKAYNTYEAIEYLTAMRGMLFDEKTVDVFKNSISVYPSGTGVVTNTGEICIVIKQNKDFTTRPVLRKLRNINGETYTNLEEIDLLKEKTVFIVDTYEL